MNKLTYSLVISAVAVSAAVPSAHATGDAIAQSSLSQFSITPDSGTFSLINIDTATMAQVGTSFQQNSGGPTSFSGGLVPYGTAFARANTLTPLNGNGVASSSTQVPLQSGYTLSSQSSSTITGSFEITGGTGQVNTVFSASVLSFINLFTDSFGQVAQGSTSFAMDVNGSPVFQTSQLFTIGASDSSAHQLAQMLSQGVELNYNQQYTFELQLDSATLVSAVPEPTTVTLVFCGMGGLLAARRFRKKNA